MQKTGRVWASRPAMFLFLVCAVFIPIHASVFAGNVVVEVDKQVVQVGESIELRFVITGDLDGDPSMPDLQGVSVESRGKSSNVSIINGTISRTVTLSYSLTFNKSGPITLPGFRFRVDDQEIESKAVQFEVKKVEAYDSERVAKEKPLFFIERDVSNAAPFVSEPVVETVKIYRRVNWESAGRREDDNPNLKYYEVKGTSDSTVDIEGITYGVATYRRVFVPLKAGETELGRAGIDVSYQGQNNSRRSNDPFGGFFGRRNLITKNIVAPQVMIGVNKLPAAGKPKDFSGFVGDLSLSSELSTTKLKTGETTTLTITFEGSGWISSLRPLSPEFNADVVKVYPDKPDTLENVSANGLSGTKTLKFAIVPVKVGVIDLGSYKLSYFDPATKKYIEKTISLGTIEVSKGESVSLTSNVVTDSNKPNNTNEIASSGADIFDLKRSMDAGFFSQSFLPKVLLALSGIMIVFLLISEFVIKQGLFSRRKSSAEQFSKLVSGAKKAVKSENWELLYTQFRKFVASQANMSEQSVTFRDIEHYFSSHNMKVSDSLMNQLKYYELANYGSKASSQREADKNDLLSAIKDLTYHA